MNCLVTVSPSQHQHLFQSGKVERPKGGGTSVNRSSVREEVQLSHRE